MERLTMDCSVDQTNYFAIELLEKMGNNAPTQEQIDMAEGLLSLLGLRRAAKCEWLRATSAQFKQPLFTRHHA